MGSKKLTALKRPLVRRLGDRRLVVRVTEDAVELRGYRKRKWKRFTWEQVAVLSDDAEPITQKAEHVEGAKVLESMGATAGDDTTS